MKVIRLNVRDAALVNVTGSDVSTRDQLAEPRSGFRVILVVISRHELNFRRPCHEKDLSTGNLRHDSDMDGAGCPEV